MSEQAFSCVLVPNQGGQNVLRFLELEKRLKHIYSWNDFHEILKIVLYDVGCFLFMLDCKFIKKIKHFKRLH